MKKLLALTLLLTYFLVSSGFVVCLHYCMDRLDSFEIGASTGTDCPRCGMEKTDGCCKVEVVNVKLATSHMASPGIVADFSLPSAVLSTTDFLLIPFRNFEQNRFIISHSPPLDKQDIYLENRVFRI